MLDPVGISAISIGFGILFLMGAVHKVTGLAEFRATLEDYRLFPASISDAMAIVVIAVEGVLGTAWLFLADRRIVAAATITLLFAYAGAIAINLQRGRAHISCGCSLGRSAGGVDLLSGWLVGRNLLLAAIAAAALLPVTERSFGALDYFTLAAAVAGGTPLFAAANQLIHNRAAIGNWRRGKSRDD